MKVNALFDVKDLATVVTGGASGLGLAYAEAMADNGARVALLDVDRAGLDRAVAKLKGRGGDVRGIVVDVTDRPALRVAIDDAAGAFGRLDVLFANAGIDPGPAFISALGERVAEFAFENVSDERWDKVIATNLSSVFVSIRAAVPHMKKNGRGGRIIVTTSIAGIKPEAIVGMPYMPAKAGSAHLVRQAALELAKYNILVNAIAPGPFVTNIGGGHMQKPEVRKAFESWVPLGRAAETEEIQGAALFLASPASKYVTGTEIVIDGGCLVGRAD
jgi:NAD(P)-dependent dehydrogenase (short-subunit alcohol dehydrogenase family)